MILAMDPAKMLKGRTRETDARRDARGQWWKGDDPVDHPNLAASFDGWIERAEDGRLCLSNDINWAYVAIEGPPYFVRSVSVDQGEVTLRLSGGQRERLDPATLRVGPEGALWAQIKNGTLAARFDNHAAVGLEAFLGEGEDGEPQFDFGAGPVRPPSDASPLAWPR